MPCRVCEQPAVRQCRARLRFSCRRHGDRLCVACAPAADAAGA